MDAELADMLGSAGFSTWYSLPGAPHHQQRTDDVQGEREQARDANDAEVGETFREGQHRADGDDRGDGEGDERDVDRPLDVRVRVLEVEHDEHRNAAEQAGEPIPHPRAVSPTIHRA